MVATSSNFPNQISKPKKAKAKKVKPKVKKGKK